MIKIGITGGIGSGKTTTSREFLKLGAYHFNADIEAKNLIRQNIQIQESIIKNFGNNILNKHNKIDYFKLSIKAFKNKKNQIKLNEIIHPHIISLIENLYNTMQFHTKNRLFIIDAPLIFESGLNKKIDSIIFIKSDINKRIKRAILRGRHPKDEIMKRFKLQMNEKLKEQKSDYIIENNDSLYKLKKKVLTLYDKIIF